MNFNKLLTALQKFSENIEYGIVRKFAMNEHPHDENYCKLEIEVDIKTG